MPRHCYRQDPLQLGAEALSAELFGPEQPNPPGLQVAEQGKLGVGPLGPLFELETRPKQVLSPILTGSIRHHEPTSPPTH